jgi:hypothetical protein
MLEAVVVKAGGEIAKVKFTGLTQHSQVHPAVSLKIPI